MFSLQVKYSQRWTDLLSDNKKSALLYADFNVINYLYESGYQNENPDIIFYPDSTAVFTMINFFKQTKYKWIASTDLLNRLLTDSIHSGSNLFFFGNSKLVLEKLTHRLKKLYPSIRICGVHNGYNYSDIEVISTINESNTDILFVGLGARRQEKWIVENFHKLECRLIVTCGGWFNFLSGDRIRAPLLLRKIHLEWFYKLMTEFNRIWKRYLLGVPQFFYRTITNKIRLEINSAEEK